MHADCPRCHQPAGGTLNYDAGGDDFFLCVKCQHFWRDEDVVREWLTEVPGDFICRCNDRLPHGLEPGCPGYHIEPEPTVSTVMGVRIISV